MFSNRNRQFIYTSRVIEGRQAKRVAIPIDAIDHLEEDNKEHCYIYVTRSDNSTAKLYVKESYEKLSKQLWDAQQTT